MTTEGLDALRERVAASLFHAERQDRDWYGEVRPDLRYDYRTLADAVLPIIAEQLLEACQQQRAADVEALRHRATGLRAQGRKAHETELVAALLASLPLADNPSSSSQPTTEREA